MFNSITSLFLVLTIGSIPGQLMVLFVVAFFKKTRFKSVDAKVKKYLLLISYFLSLLPFFYIIANQIYSSLAEKGYTASAFDGDYYVSNISNTFFRNEWVMPLAFFWFVGVIFNLYRSRRRLMDFREKVMLEGITCSIHELDIDCSELPAQIINYLSKSTIIKHPAAQSPLVFGYRKRFLIIPDQTLTQNQLHMIICHEMTHLKHKDLWAKLLAEITRLVFFYNLVFIYASQMLDEICEQLCDRAATAEMSPEQKKEYGYLLLNMLEQAEPGNQMTQAALSKDKKQLKTRLQAIVNPLKVSPLRQSLVAFLAVAAILISLITIAMIIPEVNEWDRNRQLLSDIVVEENIYPTSTYIVDYNDEQEMTYANPIDNYAYEDDGIYETTTFVTYDEPIIVQTTTVVD